MKRIALGATFTYEVPPGHVPQMRDVDGVEFEPDMVEIGFGRSNDGSWFLTRAEVGGPGMNLPHNYFMVESFGPLLVGMPTWVEDFVSAIDPDEELHA